MLGMTSSDLRELINDTLADIYRLQLPHPRFSPAQKVTFSYLLGGIIRANLDKSMRPYLDDFMRTLVKIIDSV